MNFVKPGMMLIIILLCLNPQGYCFFQADGDDLEPAIQEMVVQRKVLKENYIAYKKQKELEKDEIRQRLVKTQNRLEQIQSSHAKNNLINKNIENNKLPGALGLQKKEKIKSSRLWPVILLFVGLVGVIFWIIEINKKNNE